MRIILSSTALLVLITMAAFTGNKNLVVTSTAFTANGQIPKKYSCLGQQASPPLSVSNVPAGTVTLAIIVDDPDAPDKPAPVKAPAKNTHKKHVVKKTTTPVAPAAVAPTGCFTQWIIWNIEPDGGSIPENFKNETEGLNGTQNIGYTGVCPPTGTHHYHFKVYALNTRINIPRNSDKATLEKVMQGHILAWGELVGQFNKTYN